MYDFFAIMKWYKNELDYLIRKQRKPDLHTDVSWSKISLILMKKRYDHKRTFVSILEQFLPISQQKWKLFIAVLFRYFLIVNIQLSPLTLFPSRGGGQGEGLLCFPYRFFQNGIARFWWPFLHGLTAFLYFG